MERSYFRVRADIDLDAIRTNIESVHTGLKKGTMICAVIKANGYGHGAIQIAQNVSDLVDGFAVATMEEALKLREHNVILPILILGYVHHFWNEIAVQKNIRLTVFDFETAEKISDAAESLQKKAKVHIKVDTGMNRIGFAANSESITLIKKIKALPGIDMEGLYTHLFAADESDKVSAMKQIRMFREFANELEREEVFIPIKHCSNSAASISLQDAGFNMVRLGIAMYGLYPSKYVKTLVLKPSLSLKSHITMVKTIRAGSSVSYGATWTASKETVVATIPVGYADGYMRILSNRGCVLVHGERAPIIGTICMDQFMVDVSRISNVKTV